MTTPLDEIRRLLNAGDNDAAIAAMRRFIGSAKQSRNRSWQQPRPTLRKRKGKPGVWSVRYRRYFADGTTEHPREFIGNDVEFPNITAVKASDRYKELVERINREPRMGRGSNPNQLGGKKK